MQFFSIFQNIQLLCAFLELDFVFMPPFLFVKFSLAILNPSIFSVNFLPEKINPRETIYCIKKWDPCMSMPQKLSIQDKLLWIITLTQAYFWWFLVDINFYFFININLYDIFMSSKLFSQRQLCWSSYQYTWYMFICDIWHSDINDIVT